MRSSEWEEIAQMQMQRADELEEEIEELAQFIHKYFPSHKLGSCYLGLSYHTGPKECVCGLTAGYFALSDKTRALIEEKEDA